MKSLSEYFKFSLAHNRWCTFVGPLRSLRDLVKISI